MKCRTCGGPVNPNKDGIRVCQKCGEMHGREASIIHSRAFYVPLTTPRPKGDS